MSVDQGSYNKGLNKLEPRVLEIWKHFAPFNNWKWLVSPEYRICIESNFLFFGSKVYFGRLTNVRWLAIRTFYLRHGLLREYEACRRRRPFRLRQSRAQLEADLRDLIECTNEAIEEVMTILEHLWLVYSLIIEFQLCPESSNASSSSSPAGKVWQIYYFAIKI